MWVSGNMNRVAVLYVCKSCFVLFCSSMDWGWVESVRYFKTTRDLILVHFSLFYFILFFWMEKTLNANS